MVRGVMGYGHPQACSPIVRSPQGTPRLASFWFEIRISFINFIFFLSEAVREVPGTLVATTLGPRPLGSVALLRSQGAGGQRAFSRPRYPNSRLPLRTMTHGVHFSHPPDFKPKLYPRNGVIGLGPCLLVY